MEQRLIRKLSAKVARATALSLFLSGCAPLVTEPKNGHIGDKAESNRIAWAINSLTNPKLRSAALKEILDDWTYEKRDLAQMPAMDKALSEVLEQERDPGVRIQITKVVRKLLQDINSRRKDGLNLTIEALVKLISEDKESLVAYEAVKTLGYYRGSSELVIPALISVTLQSNNRSIIWQALHCLVCVGDNKDKNNSSLSEINTYHPDPAIRYRASRLLEYHLYFDQKMCSWPESEPYIYEK